MCLSVEECGKKLTGCNDCLLIICLYLPSFDIIIPITYIMQRRTKQENTLYDLLSSFESTPSQMRIVTFKKEDYVLIIRHYLRKRKIEHAQQALDDALIEFPYVADFFALQATIYKKTGRFEESLDMIEEAICIAPLESDFTFEKALILSELGEFEEALETLRFIRPYLNKREQFRYCICMAHIFEAQQEYELMFSILEDALRHQPDSEEALEMMWSCIEMGKLYERGIQFHKTFLDQNPYSHIGWFNLGHSYACEGLYESAIDALEYSFLINDQFETGYLDCAELCQQIGKNERSLEIYLEAYEIFGADTDINVMIAENYMKLSQFDLAKKYLLEAIYFDNYNDEAYYHLGCCYLAKRNWIAAEHAFEKAINMEDQREDYYCALAEAYIRLGRLDDAEENLQTAIELGPENAHQWLLMAQLLMDLDRYEEVLEVLEEAEENSESIEFQYYRAAALFLLSRKKDALIVLESALRDGFSKHEKLFLISPELKSDPDVLSIIHYFEGEPSNATY